jgi:hypothetical protein
MKAMRADPKIVSNFNFAPKSAILNVLLFHAKKEKKLVKLSGGKKKGTKEYYFDIY